MNNYLENRKVPIKTPFFYGWVILFFSMFIYFFSGPGQTYSVSIFVDHFIEEYDVSRSVVSGFYSGATLLAGLTLPFIGRRMDKWGYRTMALIIPFMLALTTLYMSFVSVAWMLLIGFFLLRLFGQGSMTLLSSALVPQWFNKRRGFALSLLAVGGVISSSLIPQLNNHLITTYSMAYAWRFWAIVLFAFVAPLSYFFVRNTPESIGLLPDGEKVLPSEPKKMEDILFEEAWTLDEAMKTKSFYFMLFYTIIPSMVNTGLTFHIVSIISEKGYDAFVAASIIGIIAMTQLPTTFLAGYVLDRVQPHIVKSVNFLFYFIALFIILTSPSLEMLYVYAVIHGVFNAFDSVSTGVIWPSYFGRKHLANIRGVSMTAMVIGSALGPLPFGFAFDHFGRYDEILILMMLFPLLGIVAAYITKKPI